MRKYVDRVCGFIICVLLSLMVIVACWQVFTRFVISSPSTVSEEFLRYSLIWLTMIGSAYAYGKKKHLAVVFAVRLLPEKLQLVSKYLVELVVASFIVIVLLLGGLQTREIAVGQTSAALKMPMEFLYTSIVVSGILFAFYCVLNFIDLVKYKGKEQEN